MAKKRRSSQFKDSSQVIDIEEARRKRQEKRRRQNKRQSGGSAEEKRPVRASVKQNRRRRTFIYTIWGIVSLAVWIWIFQRVSFTINIGNDTLIAALLAGVFSGSGIGLVFRFGGTTGGTDILAKLFQIKKGIPVGRMLFIFDSCILALSLSYVDLKHMMYTLIASFISMQMINLIQNGGYTVRGMLIITNHHVEVAKTIIEEIGRSATYLHGEGAYSGTEKEVLYVVLNPSEIQEVKQILSVIDPNAFASVINVHEVVGDFAPKRGRFKDLKK